MACTVRVELHQAEGYYQLLHGAMEARGFSRTIRADSGTWWRLPTAEYDYPTPAAADQVLGLARQAVASIGKTADILVTESTRRTWDLRRV